MKFNHWLTLLPALFLFACQPAIPPTVTIIDSGQVITLQTDLRNPTSILAQVGIKLNSNDGCT